LRPIDPIRVLGIDLASDPKRTAACVLDWRDGAGRVVALHQPVTDELAVELAGDAQLVAIDAPFGWPSPFVEAVAAHARRERWPPFGKQALSYRRTDESVHKRVGWWPLSVSSDRIAIVAFRAARLQALLRPGAPPVRDGSNGLLEVYPAAALHRWGLPHRGYKRAEERSERVRIVDGLQAIGDVDLAGHEPELIASDDQLDALIAALVAVALHLGLVDQLSPADADAARVEGWIWLPTGARLSAASPTS
jgi:predicted nuclease with RNAse H fold